MEELPKKPVSKLETLQQTLRSQTVRTEGVLIMLEKHLAELEQAAAAEAQKPPLVERLYIPVGPIHEVRTELVRAHAAARDCLDGRSPSAIASERGFMGNPAADAAYEAAVASASHELESRLVNAEHWLGLREVLLPHPKDKQR